MSKKRLQKAKIIAVSSGKGGVGKSNIATNLGISFADAGQNVCLFDADINLANINILLGLVPVYTLQHLFSDNKSLNDIIISGPSGLDIVAGASGVSEFTSLNKKQQQRLVKALSEIENKYDYLIVDTAAGIDDTLLSFLHAVPYLIITLTREPTSLTDAFSLLKVLKKQGYNRTVLIIINMVSGRKMAKQIFTRFSEAVSKYLQLNVRLAGYIVSDDAVSLAVQAQQALLKFAPKSSAAMCLESIAMRLLKVLDKNGQAEILLSNYFISLQEELYEPETWEQLLTEVDALDEVEGRRLYESLKKKFNHCAQPVVKSEQKQRPQLCSADSVKIILNSDTDFQYGLRQALTLAARLDREL